MRILRIISQPLIWTTDLVMDIGYLVVHGAAVRIFTLTHQFVIRGKKFDEISNITQLIDHLEKNGEQENIQKLLYRLLRDPVHTTVPDRSYLLEALKAHRYSLKALWHGVSNNSDLLYQIHGYLLSNHEHLPENSPYKNKKAPGTTMGTTRNPTLARELFPNNLT